MSSDTQNPNLVLPNLFGVTDDADAIMIQGQHEKMREAVYLYHLDTGEWPTEWSEGDLSSGSSDRGDHQLWGSRNDGDTDDVGGWDGPYVDRPILQENKWGGYWGVYEDVNVAIYDGSDHVHADYTVLAYYNA
ncbi:hypothetical protein M1N88_00475 [Dehalococcoidia bacterium]|nr:hypothetical protein [Dehalococcoidia bacterium]